MARGNSLTEIQSLAEQQVKVLRAIKKEGERHMEYFDSTMSAFKNPQARIKCFDTLYYEKALPYIDQLLKQKTNAG